MCLNGHVIGVEVWEFVLFENVVLHSCGLCTPRVLLVFNMWPVFGFGEDKPQQEPLTRVCLAVDDNNVGEARPR